MWAVQWRLDSYSTKTVVVDNQEDACALAEAKSGGIYYRCHTEDEPGLPSYTTVHTAFNPSSIVRKSKLVKKPECEDCGRRDGKHNWPCHYGW